MRLISTFSFSKVSAILKINTLKDFIWTLTLHHLLLLFCRRPVSITKILFLESLATISSTGTMEIWINRFLGKFDRIYLLILFKSFGFRPVFLVIFCPNCTNFEFKCKSFNIMAIACFFVFRTERTKILPSPIYFRL